jgi:hypothetical protein
MDNYKDEDDFDNVSLDDEVDQRPVQLNQSMLGASVILDGRPSFMGRVKERKSELPGQRPNLLKRVSDSDFELETFAPNENTDKDFQPRYSEANNDNFGGIQLSPNEDYKQIVELFVGEPLWVKSESM